MGGQWLARVGFGWYLGLTILTAAWLDAAALAAELPDGPAARPNVVLVMTDDQGYGDLACHGNRVIRTPHLDRLHAQSVRLTDFHVDPTCSPTRAALLTGRYSSRTGVWHTIAGRSILAREEVTLADLFRAAGYRTGIFGKWHLGDNYPYRAWDRGFDESLVHGGGGVGQTPDFWGNDYFDDTYWRNGQPRACQGYCTDVFFDAALEFIERHRQRPFFCYLATNAPHAPYQVPEKYAEPYRRQGVPEPMASFYGMITNIDENLGRLLARLAELGIEDQTLVIFMTDNGTAAGVARGDRGAAGRGYDAGLRGAKGSEYDGGHRVPCFFRWPGKLPAGKDVDRLTAHIDLVPTLSEICGLETNSLEFDGQSLWPLLSGAGDLPERTLLVHSQRVEQPEKWRKCAVMTERWRLVNGRELYDIEADRGQARDVAAEHPEQVARLRAAYDAWWEEVSAGFDEVCRIVLGAEAANPTELTCHDWHSDQVPWNQSMVAQDPQANGYWAVEVDRPGRYRFSLRQRPAGVEHSISAAEARLSIGPVDQRAAVPQGAGAAELEVDLPAGPARLQTWLIDADGTSRGAFFVEVERLR